MRQMRSKSAVFSLLLGLAPIPAAAQGGSTVPNWTVAPYTPSSSGITTMTDFTPPRAFVAVAPCRVVDTRNATGPYGGPALATNVARTFDIDNGGCGIPAGVEAYSLNFGGILPPADGFLTAWPTGIAQPVVSQLNLVGGEVVANAAIVPAGTNGAINVLVNIGPTHIYIDINGYFSDELGNPGNYLTLANDNPGFATAFFRNSSNADSSSGLYGLAGPSFLRPVYPAVGVRGEGRFGTLGISQEFGAAGSVVSDVDGHELAFGILGYRLPFTAFAGVYGQSYFGGSGVVGVQGFLTDEGPFAGVYGFSSLGYPGVRGYGSQVGVAGGLIGFSAQGFLGFNSFGQQYGVYSVGNAHLGGTLTANTKSFVQPHPHDASKEIRYVSLEGPQSEVYFRGTAQVSQGVSRISIPEHFRFVADPGTYSTLVTPFGAMATVAVLSQGPEGIVVQASRDVKIQYVVYAEREAVRNPDPITENIHFRPDPDIDLLAHVPESFRQLMIQNGTLNPDGTVNMDTAQRLGWDKIWEQRSRPAPQPTP